MYVHVYCLYQFLQQLVIVKIGLLTFIKIIYSNSEVINLNTMITIVGKHVHDSDSITIVLNIIKSSVGRLTATLYYV